MSKEDRIHSEGLPRGCFEAAPPALIKPLSDIIPPRPIWTPELWEKRYGAAEVLTHKMFNFIMQNVLRDGLKNIDLRHGMQQTDEQTGLAYRVLLAKAYDQILKKEMPLITHNRLGVRSPNRSIAAQGGEFNFFYQVMPALARRRYAEGKIVGVVLNPKSYKPGKDGTIQITQSNVNSTLAALIEAERAYLRIEQNGAKSDYFTQDELEKTFEWVLFGIH